MEQGETDQIKETETADGYMSAKCSACGADVDLYDSVSYVDDTSSWWGVCHACGAEVEGERPDSAKAF